MRSAIGVDIASRFDLGAADWPKRLYDAVQRSQKRVSILGRHGFHQPVFARLARRIGRIQRICSGLGQSDGIHPRIVFSALALQKAALDQTADDVRDSGSVDAGGLDKGGLAGFTGVCRTLQHDVLARREL